MSNSTTFSLLQFSPEVLHVVFYYVDVPDILRLRRVSQYLNKVTCHRNVWVNAYRTAEFPRPPGPFLSQSVHDLESILVTSFRVSRNLRRLCNGTTRREARMFKQREIRTTGINIHANLIFGRFFLVAFQEGIRCYDATLDDSDPESGASIIYRTTGRVVRSFHCVSAVDVKGCRFACAVLNEETQTTKRISIYLMIPGKPRSEMTMDLVYQSPEYNAFNVLSIDLGPRVIVIQGRLGIVPDADQCFIVSDVHARMELLLPSFTDVTRQEVDLPERGLVIPLKSISTSSHLILARSFYVEAVGWTTFFQAFTLPTSLTCHSAPTSTTLNPSHHAVIRGINVNLGGALLLDDAVLDTSTQDVLIAIRVNTFEPSRPQISTSQHGILRLSTIHTTRTMHDKEVGIITLEPLGPLGHDRLAFKHPSFNGTGRVFYLCSGETLAALEYNIHTNGENDGDHEHSAKVVVNYPSLFQGVPASLMDYDPYAGQICFQKIIGNYTMFEIFDLSM